MTGKTDIYNVATDDAPPAAAIHISVNGESRQIPEGSSVAELLTFLKLPADRVAVELDKAIVRRRNWAETVIPDGAWLEIVEFVGGG